MGNSLNNQYSRKQISKFYLQKGIHQICQLQFQCQKAKLKQQLKFVVQQLDELYILQRILEKRKNSKFFISVQNIIIQQEVNFFKSLYKVTFIKEKTPICISNLHHIQFTDVLHITYQSLQGFYELSKLIGYFHINADMIRINQDRIVKVWINQDFQKFFYIKSATQTIMVKQILNIIQQKIKISTMPRDNPSLINYMYRNYDRITFKMGLDQIQKFAGRYNNNQIPNRLKNVHNQICSKVLFSTDRIQRQQQLNNNLKLQQSQRTVFNHSKRQNNGWIQQNDDQREQNKDYKRQNNEYREQITNSQRQNKNQQLYLNNQLKIRIHTFNRQSSDDTESNQSKTERINSCRLDEKFNVINKNNKISLKCIKK